MQPSISRYLEMSLQLFLQQQSHFSDQLKELLGQAQQPVQRLKDLAERQVPIWRTVRKEFLKNLSRAKAVKTGRERNGTELDA